MNIANQKAKTILLSGGGTGGSVMPLLAVAGELTREEQYRNWRWVFVGNQKGPEREMVADFNATKGVMEFIPLISGKWRRYFSFKNFLDLFKILAAFIRSFGLLAQIRPNLVISAGGFVSVPLVWAAAIKKIPILIHQQDVRPGLANKLMAPWARVITVTFEKSLDDYGARAIWIGNPVALASDSDASQLAEIKADFGLNSREAILLVVGGGTGSDAINRIILAVRSELSAAYQIVHITGRGKTADAAVEKNYHAYEFLAPAQYARLLLIADLVVARCGLATLTELSALGKVAILIPLPNSHQEDNAAVFAAARAALVLRQDDLTAEKLSEEIKRLGADAARREGFASNIRKVIKRGATEALAGIIEEMIK